MTNPKFQPAFDIDYRRGLIGENLVGTFLESLAGSTIEVKTDFRAWETGNVYIETHQWREGETEPRQSGINTSEADWYVFAGPDAPGFIAIRRDDLIPLVLNAPAVQINKANLNSNQTRGRLVAIRDIVAVIYRKATQ